MTGPEFTLANEDCRLSAYKDTLGNWTIGVGHTGPEVHKGLIWTQAKADAVFADDYANAERGASRIWLIAPIWDSLGSVRCAALTDMVFQMGQSGVAAFTHMLTAIRNGQWQSAHDAGMASLWARQVPHRASRVMGMILTNEWPATH